MDHFYQNVYGWFTYIDLYKHAIDRFPSGSHFVEIGIWEGRSAAFMGVEILNSGKKIRYDAIDHFEGSKEHKEDPMWVPRLSSLYDVCVANLQPISHVVNIIKSDSIVASQNYQDQSLDFVFIDGGHSYESIKADITAWLPKVKKGGILAGHDYPDWAGVVKAVHEFFGENTRVSDPWGNGCWIINIQ
jgi:Methyltransferase domain